MPQILTFAAARDHLRVGDEKSDEQLAPYIDAAEAQVSDILGRPLLDAVKGWPTVEAVPANVVHGIKLALTQLYDNRAAPDFGPVERLVGRYSVVSFG